MVISTRVTYSSTKLGYPWLIDFQSAGPSHILRDVATLDAVIRLQLLTSEQATLDECLALEEALCSITHFSQLEQLKKSYSTVNPVLTKVWETTVHLRTIAYWLVEKMPSEEMSEYYAALLYVTMNTLSFSSLAVGQCEHALISACLLIDRLTGDFLCNQPPNVLTSFAVNTSQMSYQGHNTTIRKMGD